MGQYEDLLREKKRLIAQAEVRRDMAKRTQDTKSLKREVRRLKNPRFYNGLDSMRETIKKGATSTGRFVEQRTRPPKRYTSKRRSVAKVKPLRFAQPKELTTKDIFGF